MLVYTSWVRAADAVTGLSSGKEGGPGFSKLLPKTGAVIYQPQLSTCVTPTERRGERFFCISGVVPRPATRQAGKDVISSYMTYTGI